MVGNEKRKVEVNVESKEKQEKKEKKRKNLLCGTRALHKILLS